MLKTAKEITYVERRKQVKHLELCAYFALAASVAGLFGSILLFYIGYTTPEVSSFVRWKPLMQDVTFVTLLTSMMSMGATMLCWKIYVGLKKIAQEM